ncbi:MAG: Phosphoribosylglycinamide formyltransferase [Candidatus Tokpelaia hoelldobleri]|uniref:Phosphoribosylglycinamide formyltransferase n=1 Tax=Candidatus Tokpelaia hoelldobleri TaxID=1902579 RepID=A0A1U9JV37_9HYPH|nr:MAG: Phosphoribosylglycinamide formyltransferase [Candidatus Tokpelaia hoelldoblerii]
MTRRQVVIFISGSGSNMEALIKATQMPDYPATIAAVISDQSTAAGLDKARAYHVPTHIFERKAFASRQAHEDAILQCLACYHPDILCLAGYMRLVSGRFIAPYQGRILNIHPSLLPLFPGLDTHQRALDAGMKVAGCTVHLVTEGMDEGPVLAQASVPVQPDDTAQTLAQRILTTEHHLYPVALRAFIEKKLPQQQQTGNLPVF